MRTQPKLFFANLLNNFQEVFLARTMDLMVSPYTTYVYCEELLCMCVTPRNSLVISELICA
jgi:hypothetical protein